MNHFSHRTWRLILHPPGRGAWNMAVDEAILEAAGCGDAPPTLRLYAWEPPCLSLGHAQPFSDVDWLALQSKGWDVVRRPTGGRAILHADELTYSVCGPLDEPRLSGGVLESYRALSEALLSALHTLNIPAEAHEKPSAAPPTHAVHHPTAQIAPENALLADNGRNNPVCFEVPSSYEITVGGKKLIGSAQARRKEGVLQHGSLPLHGDLTRVVQVLAFPDEVARQAAVQRLVQRATTAEAVLGRALAWQEAAEAFVAAFERELNLSLLPGELTASEVSRARELESAKYSAQEWTQKN
jgi:lipoate-protein ligase A